MQYSLTHVENETFYYSYDFLRLNNPFSRSEIDRLAALVGPLRNSTTGVGASVAGVGSLGTGLDVIGGRVTSTSLFPSPGNASLGTDCMIAVL